MPPLADLMMPPPLIGTGNNRLVLPAPLETRARLRSVILALATLHRRAVGLQRDQVIADAAICSTRFSPVASSQRSIVWGWLAMPVHPD